MKKFGYILLSLFVVFALFAKWLAPIDPYETSLGERLQPPSSEHWFGTDQLGRDLFARIVYGTQISVTAALVILVMTLLISLPIALLNGYIKGRTDQFFMRFLDSILAIPDIVLTIAIVGLLGPSFFNMIIAIIVVRWASYVRFIRSLVLPLATAPYVIAGRLAGNSHMRLLWRYILPQIIHPIIVFSTLDIGKIVLNIAALSFLGLGAQPPVPEWGAMLNDAMNYFQLAPHMMIFPGLAIFLFVLSCQLVGAQFQKERKA